MVAMKEFDFEILIPSFEKETTVALTKVQSSKI
jgi:hypothetical protein